jgi:hypothetical protein
MKLRHLNAGGVLSKNMSIKETQKISAVYEKDLTKILQDLCVYDDLMAGKINCVFCGKKITYESVEYIFNNKGKVAISCNRQECKDQLKSLNGNHNGV